MYCCFDSVEDMQSQQMALGFIPFCALGVVGALVEAILAPGILGKIFFLCLLPLPGYFLVISVRGYLLYSRRYLVSEDGIIVKYPFLPETLYPWDSISEIGICKVHYALRGCHFLTAIRCVIGEEKNGPHKGYYGSWASEFYSMRHLRNVIIISYADYRAAELQKYYPKQIKDYRWIKRRPHDPE